MRALRLYPGLLLAAGFMTGCTLVEHELNADAHYTKVGKSLSSFASARQLAFHRGRLILSDEDSEHPGIAVIDTSADTVVEFYKLSRDYYGWKTTFAVVRESLLVVGRENSDTWLINLNQKSNTSLSIAMGRLRSSEGRAFRLGPYGAYADEIASVGAGFSINVNLPYPLYSLAISNAKMFVGTQQSQILWIANTLTGGGGDSLDLRAFTHDSTARPYELVSHEGRIFVHMYSEGPAPAHHVDTNFVLVIRADSLTLEKTIRLGSTVYNEPLGMPNITDGIWYLTRWNGSGAESGVEAIDLNTRAYLGLVVSGENGGYGVRHFARTGRVQGYVIYGDVNTIGKVRRISL